MKNIEKTSNTNSPHSKEQPKLTTLKFILNHGALYAEKGKKIEKAKKNHCCRKDI